VRRIVPALVLALASVPMISAASDGGAPLPRDRQILLDRHIGHLTAAGGETCIQRRRIAETIIISDQRVLYRASRGLVFDAALNPGCANLARSPYQPSTNARGSQLCSGDTIEVVNPGQTASCTIASFTRWERSDAD
jgi:hypothetical protein